MHKPEPENYADPKESEKRNDRVAREKQKFGEDLLTVLGTPQGRRFYWRLMTHCGIYKNSFTGNSQTFFNEGMRNVGLKLMGDLMENAPEMYILMIKENKHDDR